MSRLVIITFFLLILKPVLSQPGKRYTVQEYTTENGLPSNGIKGLQLDETTGFLWIATEAGISRFNGIDFKNFNQQNTPTIFSERMTFLIRNNAGRIYTADLNGNIHYVSRNTLKLFGKLHSTSSEFFDNRFTLTISDSLFERSKKFSTKENVSFINTRYIPVTDTSCFINGRGKLYLFTPIMDSLAQYGPKDIGVMAVFKLENRLFLISNSHKLYEIDLITRQYVPITLENGIDPPLLFNELSHIYWINGMTHPIVINQGKAWKLQLSGNKITSALIADGVPTDALISYIQYSEKQQTLFVGTESKGIAIISENRVSPMKSMHSQPNERNAYYSQLELPNGAVLTGEGHMIGNLQTSKEKLPIRGKFGNYLTLVGDSLLWFTQSPLLGSSYLLSYNAKTSETHHYPKIIGAEFLIHPMQGGQLLLVSESGIGYLQRDTVKYLYQHPGLDFNNTISAFKEVSPGKFLLASCSGILQFDLSSPHKLDTILKTDGLCIRSIWKYGPYYFLGSYGRGFFMWKDGVLKGMPLDKNKYLQYAHCFIPDEEGYCWISTNRGLFKTNLDELINAYENNVSTVYYHYFGKKDGMDMIEMNGGCNPCALKLKSKTLSFPTMDGLLWVDPVNAKPVLPTGELFIDELTADSIIYNTDSQKVIVFPAKTKEITIKLSYAAWCNRENIYVDYQLNDTTTWRPLSAEDAVLQFSNLPAGNYTLRFRKLNGFGINNYTYKTIRFSIIKPWHQQWWFTILAMMVLAGIVAIYLHFRTRQFKISQRKLERQVAEKTKELQEQNEVLEKNNTIKTRLISIISHDIVTPLKFLTVAGKNLLEKKQLMSEDLQRETIGEITNTSQELQLLSTNILNWIKYQNENRRLTREKFNLYEMVQQVLGILNTLAQQKNLKIANEIDPHAQVFQFYEPLKILVYNLLTNAIHFSERGTIVVAMRRVNNNVIISVKDEGVGMSPEKVQSLKADHIVISSANVDNKKGHGLGFLIIKDLLKTMGATVEIESKLGEGSTISIVFPN